MPKILNIVSHSEEETLTLAKKIVQTFKKGDVVVLTGELGSGKTIFAKGLAIGLGHTEDVLTSPSYTIVNEYSGDNPVYHFDMYRLNDISELREIGWEDYLQKEGLIVVEWGEKIEEALPENYYQVDFKIINESEREIIFSIMSKALKQ